MKLSTKDYKKILKFYGLSIPKKSENIKKKADKIIAKKFCSCIKKVQQKFREEGIAIGICTNSVITRKGYKRGKFKCKKRRTINLHKGGKRRKKKGGRRTRKKRGKGGAKTPRTSEMNPKNSPQHIPPLVLPPNITVGNAEVENDSIEQIFLHNLTVSIIGLQNPNTILEILQLYQNDYNGRIAAGIQPSGNFGELLNNDIQALQNYINYLQSQQSGGCFPNCKTIKEYCVGCLKPARVEPTPLGVVMDNEGNIIQDGRSSLGIEVREGDGPINIWALNRTIERLNSEGEQLQNQIIDASPFQKGRLEEMFKNKKNEWLEAKRQLLVEENKIAATPVAYPGVPVTMRR